MSNPIEDAITAFSSGLPVCLFDSEKREGETDLLFSAQHATPATMRQLRQDCGGLLFLAIGHEVGERFGLPFCKIYIPNLNFWQSLKFYKSWLRMTYVMTHAQHSLCP